MKTKWYDSSKSLPDTRWLEPKAGMIVRCRIDDGRTWLIVYLHQEDRWGLVSVDQGVTVARCWKVSLAHLIHYLNNNQLEPVR